VLLFLLCGVMQEKKRECLKGKTNEPEANNKKLKIVETCIVA
jgi:hypothetical protein